MFNRFVPALVFALVTQAQAQESSFTRHLEQSVALQVRTLRQISHATTEAERMALAMALDEESSAWPASLQERIDSAAQRFETARCPRGLALRRDEEGVPYCVARDGTEEDPALNRWLQQEDELLYACTFLRDDGERVEVRLCSRLNLLTDELIGRNLEDAVDRDYLQADVYAREY